MFLFSRSFLPSDALSFLTSFISEDYHIKLEELDDGRERKMLGRGGSDTVFLGKYGAGDKKWVAVKHIPLMTLGR
jgi:hypothetical protein